MARDIETGGMEAASDPLLPDQDCSTGAWHKPQDAGRQAREVVQSSAVGNSTPEPTDAKSIAASVATLLFSVPALVGSWCWPLLLAGFLGITASAGAKAFSHSLSFGITLAALTNLAQYLAWKTSVRSGTHWQRYGPLYLMLLAVPLVMADLTRHVLQDSDIWSGPSSSMYRPNCGHSAHGLGGLTCLSVTGVLFTIVFTYTGFACMIAGVFWGADMGIKFRQAWRNIRAARRRQA